MLSSLELFRRLRESMDVFKLTSEGFKNLREKPAVSICLFSLQAITTKESIKHQFMPHGRFTE